MRLLLTPAAVAIVAATVACSSSRPAPRGATPGPAEAAEVPPPASSYALVLRHAAADADRMCACPDPACVEQVEAERTGYGDHLPDDPKASEAEQEEARRINQRREACRARIGRPARSGDDELIALVGPECVAYLVAVEELVRCDKLGAAADSMREASEAMRASFLQLAQLEPAARAAALEAARPACQQATEALRATSAAMGCTP